MDFSSSDEATATELAAVEALTAGAVESGTNKTVIYTSTGLVYGFDPDQDFTEDAKLPEVSAQPVKVAAERIVLDASGIVGIVFRAGLIFGRGGSTLVTSLIDAAATNGVAAYIGDGDNSWLPVHVDDLAELYVKAIAQPAGGIFNAVGNVRFTFRELAEAIGELTGTAAVSVPIAAAEQAFGPMARVLTSNSRLTSVRARATFDWVPSDNSLAEDVRAGSYRIRAQVSQ
jgi:nucleoside-diphosphate-sugar epimerase